MINEKVIIFGGSVASVKVLSIIGPKLTRDLSVLIMIMLCRKQGSENILMHLLRLQSKIDVVEVGGKIKLVPYAVYIAPYDYHDIIDNEGSIRLDVSEYVLKSRPSIDLAMKNVTDEFGEKTIGIILSGANEEGAPGMKVIMGIGGHSVIQDPNTAEESTMSQAVKSRMNRKVMSIPDLVPFLIQLDDQYYGR